jgi:hypothetical protein
MEIDGRFDYYLFRAREVSGRPASRSAQGREGRDRPGLFFRTQ